MLYKVPQKINLEDKVIGPLTFRQFLYLLAGGIPSIIIIKTLEVFGLSIFLGIILTLPLWLSASFLAFGKFQEQNMDQIIVAFLSFFRSPKIFVWKTTVVPPKVKILSKKKKTHKFSTPKSLSSRLQNLHEEISIYGIPTQESRKRIVARQKKLNIKTKIKPLGDLPQKEKQEVPSSFLTTPHPKSSVLPKNKE